MRIALKFLVWSCLLLSTMRLQAQTPSRNLDYYLVQATKYSPTINDFRNQQRTLRIDSQLVLAGTKPQVTATSAGMYAPIINGYGYDEVLSNGQALEALLNVNYELLNKKRVNNQLQSIKLQGDSIKYANNLSVYELKKSIIDQYITAYASQQDVAFNKEVINLLQREELLLKELTRNNVYKQSEYLTFLVSLKQQELTLKQAEIQYRNDFATINYLSGITDTTLVALTEPDLAEVKIQDQYGFFTKRFEIDSLKSLNQKAAIDLNYQPKLGVYVNGGYNSSLVLQPYKNFGTSVGFTLAIPIYDGRQRKMQYDKIQLTTSTSGLYKGFFIRQQQQQLYMIKQQLMATEQLSDQINEQIKFAKGLIEVDSKLLHTGDVRVADYIIAINNYMAAQNLLRQTKISRFKLINQYNYWNK